jgi:hypothetical protein
LKKESWAAEARQEYITRFTTHFNLDTTEGRRDAMMFLLGQKSGTDERNATKDIAIIFKVSDQLGKDGLVVSQTKERTPTISVDTSEGEQVIKITHGEDAKKVISVNTDFQDTESARKVYRDLIHAIYIPNGSIDEQRQFLREILEMTKDNPEKRLPVYNHYGKLVWPRPRD